MLIAPSANSSAAAVSRTATADASSEATLTGSADVRAAIPHGEPSQASADMRLALWPVIGPITSPFAPRWGGFHTGLDIAAPMYTPVRAAASGHVSFAGQPYLAYGDTGEEVRIIHSKDFMTEYVHLDNTLRPPIVHAGEHVVAGQVIGFVGLTGWTTGPHLHFMTVVRGRPMDPLLFLPPR